MLRTCRRGNHPRSDKLDTSQRRNNTQDSRITQIKHMSVVKAIGLYEHANTVYPNRKRTYRTLPVLASEIMESVPCRAGQRGRAGVEPTASDEMLSVRSWPASTDWMSRQRRPDKRDGEVRESLPSEQ